MAKNLERTLYLVNKICIFVVLCFCRLYFCLAVYLLFVPRIPEDWRDSALVALYNGKGDVRNDGAYRRVKLLAYSIKIVERVFEK